MEIYTWGEGVEEGVFESLEPSVSSYTREI